MRGLRPCGSRSERGMYAAEIGATKEAKRRKPGPGSDLCPVRHRAFRLLGPPPFAADKSPCGCSTVTAHRVGERGGTECHRALAWLRARQPCGQHITRQGRPWTAHPPHPSRRPDADGAREQQSHGHAGSVPATGAEHVQVAHLAHMLLTRIESPGEANDGRRRQGGSPPGAEQPSRSMSSK
jgi:hypothetical protein